MRAWSRRLIEVKSLDSRHRVQFGFDAIEVDIDRAGQQGDLVQQQYGFEAALPEVAINAVLGVAEPGHSFADKFQQPRDIAQACPPLGDLLRVLQHQLELLVSGLGGREALGIVKDGAVCAIAGRLARLSIPELYRAGTAGPDGSGFP